MTFFKWLAAGLLGASAGGLGWVLIWHFFDSVPGKLVALIVIAIGGLAGAMVRSSAGPHARGLAPALAATASAAIVFGIAQYVLVALHVRSVVSGQVAAGRAEIETDDYAVRRTADEVVIPEYAAAGRPLAWPEGMTLEEAAAEEDYPTDVWADATGRWQGLTDARRQASRDAWRAEYEAAVAAFVPQLRSQVFNDSFDGMTWVWLAITVGTAFYVGGYLKTDEEQAAAAEDEPEDGSDGEAPRASEEATASDRDRSAD